MRFLRITTCVFSLFSCGIACGQTSCDTLSPGTVKQLDAYSPKKFNKLQQKNNLDPKTAFEIATYFRAKNDTACKQWYLRCIELTKKKYEEGHCDKGASAEPLFYTGVCYYYTGDAVSANKWFIKAMKAYYSSKCLDYYYEETKATLDIK